MLPKFQIDYKKLLNEIIQKQIVILGPSITLAKARKIEGLIVKDDGTVTQMHGEPQAVIENLINEFAQLSEFIVKKTIEPLLTGSTKSAESTFASNPQLHPQIPRPENNQEQKSSSESEPLPKNNQETK